MIIGVVGAPAAGKSTVIASIAKALRAQPIYEDPGQHPLVRHVGGRSSNWQFLNQLGFQLRKTEQAALRSPTEAVVVELDWVSCHRYWTPALEAVGLLRKEHAEALQTVFQSAVDAEVPRADLYIELVVTPEELLRRMAQRGREYEQTEDMRLLTETLAAQRLRKSDGEIVAVDADRQVSEVLADALAAVGPLKRQRDEAAL